MPFSGRMPAQNAQEPSYFLIQHRKEEMDGWREGGQLIRNNPCITAILE